MLEIFFGTSLDNRENARARREEIRRRNLSWIAEKFLPPEILERARGNHDAEMPHQAGLLLKIEFEHELVAVLPTWFSEKPQYPKSANFCTDRLSNEACREYYGDDLSLHFIGTRFLDQHSREIFFFTPSGRQTKNSGINQYLTGKIIIPNRDPSRTEMWQSYSSRFTIVSTDPTEGGMPLFRHDESIQLERKFSAEHFSNHEDLADSILEHLTTSPLLNYIGPQSPGRGDIKSLSVDHFPLLFGRTWKLPYPHGVSLHLAPHPEIDDGTTTRTALQNFWGRNGLQQMWDKTPRENRK